MIRDFFIRFVDIFSQLLIFAIFVRVIFSWIPNLRSGRLYGWIHSATEPVLSLARKITPNLGMIDISPIIAFIGIEILRSLIFKILLS